MVSTAATLDFHIFCRSAFDHVLTLFIGNVKIYSRRVLRHDKLDHSTIKDICIRILSCCKLLLPVLLVS